MDARSQTCSQGERSSRKEVTKKTTRSDGVVTCSQATKNIKMDARSRACSQRERERSLRKRLFRNPPDQTVSWLVVSQGEITQV